MSIMDWLKKRKDKQNSSHPRVKVPTVLQMEATECGAASLAMILALYGQWVPLETLRAECGVNRDGSKASNILRAARARGCKATGLRIVPNAILKTTFPLIIHWEFNHFVVLEGIKDGLAYLNDPAVGRRKVPWEEFRTSYTGVAIRVEPGENFQPSGKPYNIFGVIAEKLLQDKWAMVLVSLIGLGLILPGLTVPVIRQIFLDDIMTGKHPDWMFNLILAMLCAVAFTGVLTALRAVVLTRWQRKLTLADSSSFFWHTLRLPMQFFQQRYAAEVASRVAFNESVAAVLSDAAATAVLDFIVAVFFLLLLLQYSVVLTLVGVGMSMLDIAVFMFSRRRMTDLNMRIQQDSGKEYGTLVNSIMMIESVKAGGSEADVFAKWAGYHTKVLAGAQEMQFWSLMMNLLPGFLSALNMALILTLGGFSIMEGLMTVGIYMAFQNLMGSFQAPVDKLLHLGLTLQTTEMQMRRLDDVRRYPMDKLNYGDSEPGNMESLATAVQERLSGELTLKDICFGYSPLEPPLIENFSLHLEPGRWVAVVGASGSGKSTLAKIVSGLYEEWSGEILLDGRDRREIPRSIITGSMSVVDQDIFQLSGTVLENITMFDKSIRRSDVIQAAKDACIHDDIQRLDGGYEAIVSEGGLNFSGGQRQRLEIARALAKNPSLLILDEATSALDPVTEKQLLENIRQRGCSCLLVAHRLSTIRDCDEIIVLDRGKVQERGKHCDMMLHDGPYRRLIQDSAKEDT